MAQEPVGQASPDAIVRGELARADRQRRLVESSIRLWRIAPWTAAACALAAVAGRVLGWPGLMSIALLAAAAAALAGYAFSAGRPHPVTDRVAVDLDARASLGGELRSAFWFASVPTGPSAQANDPWIRFHLAHAAERLRAIDWSALYPAARASREKAATALMTVLVLITALFVPGRSPLSALTSAGGTEATAQGRATTIPAGLLPPALLREIEKLLATAESGKGKELTEAQVRDLLSKLDELRSGQADTPRGAADKPRDEHSKADLKALAERARRDSEDQSLEPEVRDALTDMANKLSEDSRATTAKDAREAAGSKDTQQGDSAQSASASDKQDGSMQSMKEAAAGGGVGIVMMASESSATSKEAGLGLGGGDGDNKKGGSLADLGAALRKETVEAKADTPGENVVTGVKRRTEQGDATVAYTHVDPGAAERGRSTAPPAVPDSRKAAVRSYFTRKQ